MKVIIINSPKYGKKEVLVDDSDYNRLSKITWTLQKYNSKFIVCGWVDGHTEKIHRYILNIPYKSKIRTVHIDGNNFNNQRENLKSFEKCQFFILENKIKMRLHSHAFGIHDVYFDKCYFNKFKKMTWRIVKGHKTFYPATIGDNNKMLFMYRIIMHSSKSQQIDHVDGNGLNNLRSNLRDSDPSQNKFNSGKRKDNTSGYKGVVWNHYLNKWIVVIKAYNKAYYGGCFKSAIDAAEKYNQMAIEHHGDFAKLNEIPS